MSTRGQLWVAGSHTNSASTTLSNSPLHPQASPIMQSEVDNVASHVGRLRISRKPKRRRALKSETELGIHPLLNARL